MGSSWFDFLLPNALGDPTRTPRVDHQLAIHKCIPLRAERVTPILPIVFMIVSAGSLTCATRARIQRKNH